MIDIDENLFWSLGGPAGFVRAVVDAAQRDGFVAVQVPTYRPPGLVDALTRGLEADGMAPVHRVSDRSRASIVHRMAFAAGEIRQSLRSVGSMLDSPTLRGTAFVADGIDLEEWSAWSSFLRSFTVERRRRRSAVLLPVLVAFIPPDTPQDDVDRLFPGAVVRWRGRVSSFDMRTYVARRTGRTLGEDLLDRSAIEVAIGLAGYDPYLAEMLCRQEPLTAIDPWELLQRAYGRSADVHPRWGNGLVDTVDGEVFLHTACLLASGNRKAFDVRRWRAVSGPVLDFNATVCRHFADVYAQAIEARLPYRIETARGEQLVTHRYDMENKHLRDCLEGMLERQDVNFLRATNKARNNIAHNEVPDPSLLSLLASSWSTYAVTGRKEVAGWNWPRCGQRLVLMIGPSGAGKSTYARANFAADEIVSSDDIRIELFGSQATPGSQAHVFEVAMKRLTTRLARGDTAVLDATNIQRRNRLQVVDLVPTDMEVEYVVIDRDIEEKRRDGGWRNEREGLIDGHSQIFANEIADILGGDGRINVRVTDLRMRKSVAA
ncbi:AAA family ATPase [Mesorhizobium sp.]|uniref:AAA family ATPase n=1 Tax=Mesorhizobium sp. TaxID=1871066 RepID=UPI0025E01A05|nr:AAA family ATPase [Mesorhizobium sp.]